MENQQAPHKGAPYEHDGPELEHFEPRTPNSETANLNTNPDREHARLRAKRVGEVSPQPWRRRKPRTENREV